MATNNFALTTFSPYNQKKRLGRLMLRGAVFGAAASAAVCMTAASAAAAPGEDDTGSTDAHVAVETAIVLSGLTDEFTLTGIPGATVGLDGAVTLNVETNNLAGYAVTVQSQTETLAPGTPGNGDAIPIGALSVRETGTTPFTAMDNLTTAVVHSQTTRSAELGDTLSNDYQVVLPFVNEDTYTATLDYVATTL
jgi:hypothetical protein